jgi:hypothetical protein
MKPIFAKPGWNRRREFVLQIMKENRNENQEFKSKELLTYR